MDSLTILALKKAESGGGGGDITVESLSVSQNGTYTATTGKAYSPVTVAVPQTTVSSLSVTENGTYTAQSGTAYSPVTVNVPSGGGSSYTKIYTTEVTANTTSTSATELTVISTGVTFQTESKYIFVCIHDKEGSRNDHFYGTFTCCPMKSSWSNTTIYAKLSFSVNSSGEMGCVSVSAGVYPYKFYSDGKVGIYTKYDSTSSRTVDGTYIVDVYIADYPTGFYPMT